MLFLLQFTILEMIIDAQNSELWMCGHQTDLRPVFHWLLWCWRTDRWSIPLSSRRKQAKPIRTQLQQNTDTPPGPRQKWSRVALTSHSQNQAWSHTLTHSLTDSQTQECRGIIQKMYILNCMDINCTKTQIHTHTHRHRHSTWKKREI